MNANSDKYQGTERISVTEPFTPENINRCKDSVYKIQTQIDKAVVNDDKSKIHYLTHYLMKRSLALKVIAINRVCQINTGKYTAGVDGVTPPIDWVDRQMFMLQLLQEVDFTKDPMPIRRVFIPKPSGKQRPLGIPTILDRTHQEIVRQTIEPICEFHFLHCSHGFRPKRSCHDAISALFTWLSRRNSRVWVVEADIEKCFDFIDHQHILKTLEDWLVPKQIIRIVDKMLKSGISLDSEVTPSWALC